MGKRGGGGREKGTNQFNKVSRSRLESSQKIFRRLKKKKKKKLKKKKNETCLKPPPPPSPPHTNLIQRNSNRMIPTNSISLHFRPKFSLILLLPQDFFVLFLPIREGCVSGNVVRFFNFFVEELFFGSVC